MRDVRLHLVSGEVLEKYLPDDLADHIVAAFMSPLTSMQSAFALPGDGVVDHLRLGAVARIEVPVLEPEPEPVDEVDASDASDASDAGEAEPEPAAGGEGGKPEKIAKDAK